MNSGWWVAVSAVAIALSKAPNVLPKDGACFALGQDYVNGVPRDYEGSGDSLAVP